MATIAVEPEQRELKRAPTLPPKRSLRLFGLFRDHWLTIVIVFVLLWIIGIPLLTAIGFSFRTGTPAAPGSYTLQNYSDAYANPLTPPALKNTAIVGIAVSVISVSLATLFAWLVERTDMPGRNFAWVVMLLPIAMPGMLSCMGWVLLLSQKIGLVNIAIRDVLSVFGIHLSSGPFNVYSIYGIIFVEVMRSTATLFLLLVAALRLMDPSLEEAASVSGVRTWATFRTITLKLMTPALLAAFMYGLIGNMEDLEVPLMIGLPGNVFVLPTLIYFTSQNNDWGLSAAYTTMFLAVTICMVLIYYKVVIKRASNFAVITGKSYRPRRLSLGKMRWPAFGAFFAFFLVTVVLPIGVLIWASLLKVYEVPSKDSLHKLTLSNYADLKNTPNITHTVWNTLTLAGETATVTMILAFFAGWLIVRQRIKGGLGLDALTFMPHAIPSVAVAVALVAFYLNPAMRGAHIYGTVTIMVLALTTRFITFASRTANSAMTQLGNELEEAAHVSGVGRLRTTFRITFRLLSPAFIAGFIWIAANSIRNLTIPLMLSTSENGTIATNLYFEWQRRADFSGAATLGVAMVAVLALLAIAARRVIAGGFSDSK
jgi:iron(III) transport system permease protein